MKEQLKILLLEDSDTDAEIVMRLLKKSKPLYEFRLAMSEKDYKNALDEFRPDLILSDNSMPQFSAKEALEIKAAKQYANSIYNGYGQCHRRICRGDN